MGDDDTKLGGRLETGSKIGESAKQRRDKSTDQEDRVAERAEEAGAGGRGRVPASGALGDRSDEDGFGPCGDVDLDGFRVECKRTSNKSLRLGEDVLRGAAEDAWRGGKEMALQVDLDGIDSPVVPSSVVVLPEEAFYDLLDAAGADADGKGGER